MSISHKHNQSHARNVEESISNKGSSSEKPQSSLQEQAKTDTSQSPSSAAKNADTLIVNSNQKKLKNWSSKIYYGLQGQIYFEED